MGHCGGQRTYPRSGQVAKVEWNPAAIWVLRRDGHQHGGNVSTRLGLAAKVVYRRPNGRLPTNSTDFPISRGKVHLRAACVAVADAPIGGPPQSWLSSDRPREGESALFPIGCPGRLFPCFHACASLGLSDRAMQARRVGGTLDRLACSAFVCEASLTAAYPFNYCVRPNQGWLSGTPPPLLVVHAGFVVLCQFHCMPQRIPHCQTGPTRVGWRAWVGRQRQLSESLRAVNKRSFRARQLTRQAAWPKA